MKAWMRASSRQILPLPLTPSTPQATSLTRFFEAKKRNFATYWDPATNDIGDINKDNRTMVRVNCKFDPNDTKIKFPPYMKNWKKTTIGRSRDDGGWILIEDRADMYEINNEFNHCNRLCIFT